MLFLGHWFICLVLGIFLLFLSLIIYLYTVAFIIWYKNFGQFFDIWTSLIPPFHFHIEKEEAIIFILYYTKLYKDKGWWMKIIIRNIWSTFWFTVFILRFKLETESIFRTFKVLSLFQYFVIYSNEGKIRISILANFCLLSKNKGLASTGILIPHFECVLSKRKYYLFFFVKYFDYFPHLSLSTPYVFFLHSYFDHHMCNQSFFSSCYFYALKVRFVFFFLRNKFFRACKNYIFSYN